MPLTPEGGMSPELEVERLEEQTSQTYRIDVAKGRISGRVDGLDAVRQAIYLLLQTERFRYLIYSWNYGTELQACIGKSAAVFESEIERVVTEALTSDERILEVSDFKSTIVDKRTAKVEFTAVTIFGQITIEEEVIL